VIRFWLGAESMVWHIPGRSLWSSAIEAGVDSLVA